MAANTSSRITPSKKAANRIVDPVTPQQGGRSMPSDPTHPLCTTREEAVRKIAYEIYLRRGRTDGRAERDWLEAEARYREILGE